MARKKRTAKKTRRTRRKKPSALEPFVPVAIAGGMGLAFGTKTGLDLLQKIPKTGIPPLLLIGLVGIAAKPKNKHLRTAALVTGAVGAFQMGFIKSAGAAGVTALQEVELSQASYASPYDLSDADEDGIPEVAEVELGDADDPSTSLDDDLA